MVAGDVPAPEMTRQGAAVDALPRHLIPSRGAVGVLPSPTLSYLPYATYSTSQELSNRHDTAGYRMPMG